MATASNKRPTPAKSPAQLKAVPKSPAKLEDDDDDLDDDGGSKGPRVPMAQRVANRMENSVNRIIKMANKIDTWTPDAEGLYVDKAKHELETAISALKQVVDAIKALPDDYKSRAPKARKGKQVLPELEKGDKVRLSDKAWPEHAEAASTFGFEQGNMVVLSQQGTKVYVTASDGGRTSFSRGELVPDVSN